MTPFLGGSNAKCIFARFPRKVAGKWITKNHLIGFPNSFAKDKKKQSELILQVIERWCERTPGLFIRVLIAATASTSTVDHDA